MPSKAHHDYISNCPILSEEEIRILAASATKAKYAANNLFASTIRFRRDLIALLVVML